jgi:hypothetical protein
MKISDLAVGMFHAIAPQYTENEIRERCETIEVFSLCQSCNLLRFSDGKHEEEFCEKCDEPMQRITEESMRELDEEFAC